jgi:hypothetical protein
MRRFEIRVHPRPSQKWAIGYAKWHRPPLRLDVGFSRVWIGWG